MRARLYPLAILLVAAAIRLYGLNNLSPPGLAHDEVANWLIDRSILAGHHAIYFTAAYGHEAGFHYLQALFVALLGDHALALRLPAAFSGLLLVAVTYALANRLFNRPVALLTAALLAVLFWPVFYSRQGLRAISLPLLSALSAYLWWRAIQVREPSLSVFAPLRASKQQQHLRPSASIRGQFSRDPWFLLPAGLLAGLSLHTYMAARVVPIFYAAYTLYLLLFHRTWFRRHWPALLLFWLALLIVAAPLALYLLNNPGAEFRISEIDIPLRALLAGNPLPALENTGRILAMFGLRGDPLWRQNVAPQPVFDPLLALLFYAGLLLCLLRLRDPRYAFLGLWTVTAFIPSILTVDAPSSIRIINILPALTLLPVLVIHSLCTLSTGDPHLSTGRCRNSWIKALTLLVLLFHLSRTALWLFQTWPADEEVQFVWQHALTQAAAHLDAVPAATPVAIGAWSPDTMDPPTLALTLRRDDLSLRFFDPQESLIIPAATPARILHPTILPLSPLLAGRLAAWGATPQTINDFTLYHLDQPSAVPPTNTQPALFGNELLFLGYELGESCHQPQQPTCQLLTYWRVQQPPGEPRRIFLHLLDPAGELITQDDGLGVPPAHWQPGDLIIQQHTLESAGPPPYTLRLGIYNPDTRQRLPLANGQDTLLLNAVR